LFVFCFFWGVARPMITFGQSIYSDQTDQTSKKQIQT